MRIVRRIAERAIDPRLELFRDHVLEPFRLVMDVVHVQSERLGEVELEQAVVANDLERNLFARARERDPAIRLVSGEAQGRELLHHRACGCRRHTLALCERRHGDAPVAVGAELVDLAQIVLDRVRQRRLRHRITV